MGWAEDNDVNVHPKSPETGASEPRLEPFDDETFIAGPTFAAAKKIYPQSTHGTYRRIKWALLVMTLGVYYLLPFLRWDRGPNAPGQAVLVDLEHRRFYFFFIEIWPQEVYYFTGLLILAALTLFLMNAVAGRVWCGYLCWQTVWTDLFMAVERRVEGDRRERIQLDAAPWTAQKIAKRTTKHLLWLLVAWLTGGAWVLYFADAPTLLKELVTFQAPTIAYIWMGILTFTTYIFAGHMREQTCLYVCPWPRIQAALTDENALNVTYRLDRGEPRMSVKKAAALRKSGQLAGDCIDCEQCLHVCPTGVDIRKGPSLGCIQCGLCIDACDNVMEKIGRPARLIAYDTDVNIRRRELGEKEVYRLVRPRTVLYAVLITLITAAMAFKLATRADTSLAVIHDRNPQYVLLSDGAVRNGFVLRFANKASEARVFCVRVDGVQDAALDLAGASKDDQGRIRMEVGPDQTREARLLVSTKADLPKNASLPLTFTLTDSAGAVVATAKDFFRGP